MHDIDNKFVNLVNEINEHIKSYSLFVDNRYFEEIYSRFKTSEEIKILKDYSETNFQINNEHDLQNFIKYSEMAEAIMNNTEGVASFGVIFAECFVYHIQEIIKKIKLTIE
jgi:hypothetical protein